MSAQYGGRSSVGEDAEVKTGNFLATLCKRGGPTVLHDLVITFRRPGKQDDITINVDHVVISGNKVLILDTKSWKPGFIWTFRGKTRRGLTESFSKVADKRSVAMASEYIEKTLASHGLKFKMQKPIVVVWPSNKSKNLSVRWYRPIGAVALHSRKLIARHKRYIGSKPADPKIVAALVPLVWTAQQYQAKQSEYDAQFGVSRPWDPSQPLEPKTKKEYRSDDF